MRSQSSAKLQDCCKERLGRCISHVSQPAIHHICVFAHAFACMLAKTLDQSSAMTFEGNAEKGLCHAPFPAERKGDVAGLHFVSN
jgi:hypothetical protein